MLGAKIRAYYNVRTPDAIQLATGILSDSTQFITADRKLPKKIGNLAIRIIGQ